MTDAIDHSDSLLGLAPIVTRLLVVDDDPIQRRVIGKIGAQAGHEVHAAATLAEAFDILTREAIDCATVDLGLGEDSGYELLEALGRSGQRIETLVISGSMGSVREQTEAHAARHGLNLFALFPKPLDLAALRHSLTQARAAAWLRKDEKLAC